MPNPNNSEFKLRGWYGGDDEDATDRQATDIYTAMVDDADQIEHKFVTVPTGGQYVELVHFTEIRQLILENMDSTNEIVAFYVDAQTAALVVLELLAEEHISICVPDTAVGLWLAAPTAQIEQVHIAFCGTREAA